MGSMNTQKTKKMGSMNTQTIEGVWT
jgi:hypothetical protein